jgi:vacuolar-type H+-ATPase subunit I/STV1
LGQDNERLKSEFSTLTKEIGNVYLEHVETLSRSIDDLKVHLNMTEKEKIDQSVFNDFIGQLEMLNKRLFNLEKLEQSRRSRKHTNPTKVKREKEELILKK